MKPVRLCGVLIMIAMLVCCQFAAAQQTTDTLPISTTSETQKREVRIALPAHYSDYPSRRYVTVYLLDSQYPPYFEAVKANLDYLVSQGYLQPLILVGVSSANRQYDFTPEARTKTGKAEYRRSGGSELYAKYIDDVVRSVEGKYRCEPFRIGIGHSLGGTFLVHCLLSHHELFNANIIVSPNLVYDEGQLAQRFEEADPATVLTNRFVYMAHGKGDTYEDKFQAGTTKFAKLLRKHTAPGFNLIYDKLSNDRHGTTALEAVPKGMVQLYRHFVASDENFAKRVAQNDSRLLPDLVSFYKKGASWSGLALPMVWDINTMAYNSHYAGHNETALKLLEIGVAAHPNDINLYDSLGEIAQLSANLPLARKYYQQGLAVVESERSTLPEQAYQAFLAGFHRRIESLDKKP